jgi:signal peptide peptidase SppA
MRDPATKAEWLDSLRVVEDQCDTVLPKWPWVIILAVALAGALAPTLARAQITSKPDLVEVLEIRGHINGHTASAIKAQVETINENPKVKAVLLVVDTPGGGSSASDVLYHELAKIKAPVVGFCEYVCASGGVYALMSPSVKFIAVRPETWGGSVGVVGTMTRYNRLLEWAKIDTTTFKSGEFKDTGNPTRGITDRDQKYFQDIVDQLAGRFYEIVQKARPKADMAELKTAKVFVGERIVKVGLADAVMSREEVEKKAKELSGSKLIFTREEIKKMSRDANEGHNTVYEAPRHRMSRGWESDLSTMVDLIQEIRGGESVRFEYRMTYQF